MHIMDILSEPAPHLVSVLPLALPHIHLNFNPFLLTNNENANQPLYLELVHPTELYYKLF